MNHKQPLGIYVHIPFCVRKCLYCDFLSFPAGEVCPEKREAPVLRAYVDALLQEIENIPNLVDITSNHEIQTIFIGGGTPSLLNEIYISDILCKLKAHFLISQSAEITIEANPGTLTMSKLHAYRSAGINRLSIGLQSTDNNELKQLGRIHTYEEFLESYHMAREAGFDNLNIDLMTALPGQNQDDLCRTLERVIELNPEHISAYSLILEEGTPFAKLYNEDNLPSEEEDREMYAMTGRMLSAAGYHRYEISNYARPGYESRHNMSYWKRIPYLGLGLGAASFFENTRWKNEEDLDVYIRKWQSGISPERYEEQVLTTQMQMEEYMFLGLRMTEGISMSAFAETFGRSLEAVYGKALDTLEREALIERTRIGQEEHIRLTQRGVDLSNYVFTFFL